MAAEGQAPTAGEYIIHHLQHLQVGSGFWTLNIDHRQMGVGGTDSWSQKALPLEHYRIPAGDYQWTFILKP